MVLLSSTDLAILEASRRGTLQILARSTQILGEAVNYWAICDEHGIICSALSESEATDIVASATR